ncbi:MAG: hypothetical protein FWG07_00250 [Treponema sp.]|nr:hypothetical protein [Treponema sp.]
MNIIPLDVLPADIPSIDEDVNDIINSFPEIQFKAMEIEIFRDLCGNNNLITWDPQDIINFFKTPGIIISGCIPDIKLSMLETNAVIAAQFNTVQIKNIKKIMFCVYGTAESLNSYGRLMNFCVKFLPTEIEILSGLIDDKNTEKDSYTLKYIAIC